MSTITLAHDSIDRLRLNLLAFFKQKYPTKKIKESFGQGENDILGFRKKFIYLDVREKTSWITSKKILYIEVITSGSTLGLAYGNFPTLNIEVTYYDAQSYSEVKQLVGKFMDNRSLILKEKKKF